MPSRSRTFRTRGNQAYTAGRTPYTRSLTGAMSVNGRTAGGSTQTFTNNETGRVGRGGRIQNRATRQRDVRSGFNDISDRALQAMLEAGQVTAEEVARARRGGGRNSLGLSAG